MAALQQLWAGSGLAQMTLGQGLMIAVGLLLLYLAIVRKFEPLLLVTIVRTVMKMKTTLMTLKRLMKKKKMMMMMMMIR